jgi:transposase-like protein
VGLELDKQGHPRHIKIEAVESVDGKTIEEMSTRDIQPEAEIHTDGLNAYNKLEAAGFQHQATNFSPHENPDHLHCLHTIISNLKAFIGGTYHGLGKKYLQRYFDEFCYRFNRRMYEKQLFGRLLFACSKASSMTHRDIVNYL